MQAKIKSAVVMAATVLAVIFVARRLPVASTLVDTALNG